MEWVASINGKVSMSKGALVECKCGLLYWIGYNNCPQCGIANEK